MGVIIALNPGFPFQIFASKAVRQILSLRRVIYAGVGFALVPRVNIIVSLLTHYTSACNQYQVILVLGLISYSTKCCTRPKNAAREPSHSGKTEEAK